MKTELFMLIVCALVRVNTGLAANVRFPDEALVTATDTFDGVQIEATFRSGRANFSIFLPNESLSTACGPQYERCPRLDVLSFVLDDVNTSRHVVLVPLAGKLQLLDFIHNVHGPQFNLTDMTEIGSGENCNSMGTFRIGQSNYTVCAVDDGLRVFELLVDEQSDISEWQFRRNAAHITQLPTSNLVCIKDSNSIFFAVGLDIYSIQPIRGTIERNGNLENSNCMIGNGMTLIDDGTGNLLVYCNTNLVYYDIHFGEWRNQTEIGQFLYFCTMNIITVVTNESQTLQMPYIENASGLRYNVSVTGYDSGICFRNYFAFLYDTGGVVLLEPSTGIVEQHGSDACANTGCKPLLVFDDDYLVVPFVGVLGISDNGSTIFIVKQERTGDLSKVLTSLQSIFPEEDKGPMGSMPTTMDNTPTTVMQSNVTTTDEHTTASIRILFLAIFLSLGLLIVITFITIIITAVCYFCWRHKKTGQTSLQHAQYSTQPLELSNREVSGTKVVPGVRLLMDPSTLAPGDYPQRSETEDQQNKNTAVHNYWNN